MFKGNVGKDGVVFPSGHPYYKASKERKKAVRETSMGIFDKLFGKNKDDENNKKPKNQPVEGELTPEQEKQTLALQQKYLKDGLAKDIDIVDLHPDFAKVILETLAEAKTKFNLKLDLIELEYYDERNGRSVFMATPEPTDLPNKELYINPNFFSEFNSVGLDGLNRYLSYTYRLLATNLEDIVLHEVGHLVTRLPKGMKPDDFLALKLNLDEEDYVSEYSRTNNFETLAELFLYASKGNTLSAKQKELLKTYIKPHE
jgi:hypothetical protein